MPLRHFKVDSALKIDATFQCSLNLCEWGCQAKVLNSPRNIKLFNCLTVHCIDSRLIFKPHQFNCVLLNNIKYTYNCLMLFNVSHTIDLQNMSSSQCPSNQYKRNYNFDFKTRNQFFFQIFVEKFCQRIFIKTLSSRNVTSRMCAVTQIKPGPPSYQGTANFTFFRI